MDLSLPFALFCLGIFVGLLIGWAVFRLQRQDILLRGRAEAEKDVRALEERVALRDEQLRERDRVAEEKSRLIQEVQVRLSESFKALSADALQSNNRAFLDLANVLLQRFQEGAESDLEARQKAIDEMLGPVRDSLTRVDGNLGRMEKERAEAFGSLRQQIEGLHTMQQQLRTETSRLVDALRSPAVRGRWGEVQLRRVVELAGMVEHCDFEQQASVATEEGTLRPDLIVRLPAERTIVVDSKVSLRAYLEALEATSEEARQAKLREHAAQVRAHLTRLAGKAYWRQFPETPEFVVAFLPGETFFSAALEQDPELIEFGASQRVILATPTTLIALLKAVAYGWQQQKLAENAREISELGRTLYDRVRVFASYFDDLRRHLTRTVESYNRAAGSLETRVLTGARRFQELGAGTSEEIGGAEAVDVAARRLQSPDIEPSGEAKPRVIGAGGAGFLQE
jgi:DNA recombination protein RmuC